MNGVPGGDPLISTANLIDHLTGWQGAMGAMAALLHRERGGPGQYLDVSLLDVYLNGQEIAVQAASLSGGAVAPRRTGRQHFSVCPLGIFRGAQGYLVIVGLGKQWDQLCRVLGRPELATDPRYASNAARVAVPSSTLTSMPLISCSRVSAVRTERALLRAPSVMASTDPGLPRSRNRKFQTRSPA